MKESIKRKYYERYCNSKIQSIYEAYKKPSIYKVTAFNNIRLEMYNIGGEDLRIISHNSNIFTCGYSIKLHLGGEIFILHTPYGKYSFKLN